MGILSHISWLLPRNPPCGSLFFPKVLPPLPFASISVSFSLASLSLWPHLCFLPICEVGQWPPDPKQADPLLLLLASLGELAWPALGLGAAISSALHCPP